MVEIPSSSSALSFPFFPALLVARMSVFTLIHISWGVTIFTVTQKKAELKNTLRIVLYLFWTHFLIEFMSWTSHLLFLLQQKAAKTKGMPCLGANSPEREFSSSESMMRTCFYVQLYHTHISLQTEPGNPTVYVRKKKD